MLATTGTGEPQRLRDCCCCCCCSARGDEQDVLLGRQMGAAGGLEGQARLVQRLENAGHVQHMSMLQCTAGPTKSGAPRVWAQVPASFGCPADTGACMDGCCQATTQAGQMGPLCCFQGPLGQEMEPTMCICPTVAAVLHEITQLCSKDSRHLLRGTAKVLIHAQEPASALASMLQDPWHCEPTSLPAAWMRACSEGEHGLWSVVNGLAFPWLHSTALESPQLARTSRCPTCSRARAVVPERQDFAASCSSRRAKAPVCTGRRPITNQMRTCLETCRLAHCKAHSHVCSLEEEA